MSSDWEMDDDVSLIAGPSSAAHSPSPSPPAQRTLSVPSAVSSPIILSSDDELEENVVLKPKIRPFTIDLERWVTRTSIKKESREGLGMRTRFKTEHPEEETFLRPSECAAEGETSHRRTRRFAWCTLIVINLSHSGVSFFLS